MGSKRWCVNGMLENERSEIVCSTGTYTPLGHIDNIKLRQGTVAKRQEHCVLQAPLRYMYTGINPDGGFRDAEL